MKRRATDQRTKLVSELEQSLAPIKNQTTVHYQEVLDLLRAFAEQVEKLINGSKGVGAEVSIELGHLLDQGHEHRVVVRAPSVGFSDYLLRAFIPPQGYPVTLDVLAEVDRSCDGPDALVGALVELSKQPDLQRQLATIRGMLAAEPERPKATSGGVAERRSKRGANVTPTRRSTNAAPSGSKRSPQELAQIEEEVYAYIQSNPNQGVEQIAKALQIPTKELNLPLRKLRESKKISSQGQRRATRYTASRKPARTPRRLPGL